MSCESESPKVPRERLLEQKKEVTSRISDLCRYIGFGLMIVFFTLKSGGFAKYLESPTTVQSVLIWVFGAAGALTIVSDYFQYVAANASVEAALRRKEQNYDEAAWAYRLRVWLFVVKQWLAAIGAIALAILVLFGGANGGTSLPPA
jgi:hypothetical protein